MLAAGCKRPTFTGVSHAVLVHVSLVGVEHGRAVVSNDGHGAWYDCAPLTVVHRARGADAVGVGVDVRLGTADWADAVARRRVGALRRVHTVNNMSDGTLTILARLTTILARLAILARVTVLRKWKQIKEWSWVSQTATRT